MTKTVLASRLLVSVTEDARVWYGRDVIGEDPVTSFPRLELHVKRPSNSITCRDFSVLLLSIPCSGQSLLSCPPGSSSRGQSEPLHHDGTSHSTPS